MCGLSGELSRSGRPPSSEVQARMLARLVHRGPDDEGVYSAGPFAVGFRRLSILDLSPAGHMPMIDEASGLVLAMNGEIYNFRELRRDLESRGERFRSSGDAEVLLKLLAREGPAALAKLRGMYALACWDPRRRKLLLARDLFGIKPLYLWRDPERLLFASEMKAILAHPAVPRRLSPNAISHYFAFGYTGGAHPIFDGIEKLPPGSFLIEQGTGAEGVTEGWDAPVGKPVRFWDPLDNVLPGPPASPPDRDSLARELLEVLSESVSAHLVSDVPVGIFLSGGVDSAAVLALAARSGARNLDTYSVGFPGPEKESELAGGRLSARAFGSRHHEVILTADQFTEDLHFLSRHMDEPIGDAATFPTYALARVAREQVKVVLTGDGGDELFGGYRRYVAENARRRYRGLPRALLRSAGLAASLLPGMGSFRRALGILDQDDPAERGASWHYIYTPRELDSLLAVDWCPSPAPALAAFTAAIGEGRSKLAAAELLMYADQKTKLTDGYCERLDRPTMAAGLEARVPFLDPMVARFAQSLPSSMKVRGFGLKVLLRRALRGLVPQKILALPKRGFTVPIPSWLRQGLLPLVKDILRPESLTRRGILNPTVVSSHLSAFEAGRGESAERLWLAFAFELWCREHLDRAPGGADSGSCGIRVQ